MSHQQLLFQKKREWEALQPIQEAHVNRLWKKFRLEWNYHSNHIEGNTLTYGETELLLIHGDTTGNHSLREYDEMRAHDVAIGYVEKLANLKRPITEADIRDLNKILLKEEFWKEAITVEGVPTRKKIVPGTYKTQPNSVRTAIGEIFEFVSPLDVPQKMNELVTWMNLKLNAPVEDWGYFLAKLHHDFVLIHPFDDGNGRVARLLLNYSLLKLKYLPLIIKTTDKKDYFSALRRADAGDLSVLSHFLTQQLIWSYEKGIRAARGEEIEDTSDADKEMTLFIRDQKEAGREQPSFSPALVQQIYQEQWKPLLELLVQKVAPLKELFRDMTIYVERHNHREKWTATQDLSELNKRLDLFFKNIDNSWKSFDFIITFFSYQKPSNNSFDVSVMLRFEFQDYYYKILIDGSKSEMIHKNYSQKITSEFQEKIISGCQKILLETIKRNLKDLPS